MNFVSDQNGSRRRDTYRLKMMQSVLRQMSYACLLSKFLCYTVAVYANMYRQVPHLILTHILQLSVRMSVETHSISQRFCKKLLHIQLSL